MTHMKKDQCVYGCGDSSAAGCNLCTSCCKDSARSNFCINGSIGAIGIPCSQPNCCDGSYVPPRLGIMPTPMPGGWSYSGIIKAGAATSNNDGCIFSWHYAGPTKVNTFVLCKYNISSQGVCVTSDITASCTAVDNIIKMDKDQCPQCWRKKSKYLDAYYGTDTLAAAKCAQCRAK